MPYQSPDRLINFENQTLLELFEEVPKLLRGIYPLIPHLELSSRFEVVNSENTCQDRQHLAHPMA